MRRAAVLAALLPLLAGCTVVSVHTDGGPPRLSAWPLGVRVERGSAAAVSVSARGAGVWSGCYSAAAGVVQADCDVIDIRACSAALVHAPVSDPTILDRLAGATRAQCPKDTPPCSDTSEPSCSSPSQPPRSAPAPPAP